MSAGQFCNDSVWLNGPAFLWEERISYVDVNINPGTLKRMKLETERLLPSQALSPKESPLIRIT